MRGQLLAALFIVSSGIISVSQKMEYRPTCGCRKQTICRTRLAFLGHFRLLKQSRSGFPEFSARTLEGIVRNDDKCETERRDRGSSGSMESLLDAQKQQQRPISKKPREPLKQFRGLRYTFTLPPKIFTPIHTGGIKPFAPICLQLYTYLFVRLL